jgi:CRP-like cAMP-binding protein/CheY-like chemotaxis protein
MKKILIIEDNSAIRNTTAEILKLADYHVITAENGREGVELAKSNLPDLILCDILMPDLDGYGVLRILIKNKETLGIPFIFITSKNTRSDLRKGMNLGADDYIFKPFKETDLLETIETRLQRNENILEKYAQVLLNKELEISETVDGMEDLLNFSAGRKEKIVLKKEKIYQESDYSNYVYFVLKGRVKCLKTDTYGKEYVTDIYIPGNFFGFMPLQHEGEYHDTAIALEDSTVAIIPKRDFLLFVQKNQETAKKFIELLSENIKEKENRLLQLAYAPVRNRVAQAILKYGIEDKNKNLTITGITRDDLACIVGSTKESLIRILTEFKRDGLIQSDGRNIVILNQKDLKRTASGF